MIARTKLRAESAAPITTLLQRIKEEVRRITDAEWGFEDATVICSDAAEGNGRRKLIHRESFRASVLHHSDT